MQLKCTSPLCWRGCYRGTYDLWSPESYAHPAKLSPALSFKILEHLEELGLLKQNDTVLDPMGGIGTVAITAGAKGYRAITCELEEKFTGFQRQNKVYAERKLFKPLDWQIIQGDARRLSELLTERGLVSLTSPPYSAALSGGGIAQEGYTKEFQRDKIGGGNLDPVGKRTYMNENVGTTPGQISALPDKPLKAITSPPYDNRLSDKDKRVDRPPTFYSDSDDNIGNQNRETYLSAMLSVYQEIAKVSDVLAIVLKNPTRNGKLRRLDLDTIKLLEMSGWKIHCQHRALLFEELEQGDLFNGSQKKVKGRMSFFKRLSWQNGQPVASWEDVLIAVRGV